jgi:hypothetical protein
LRFYLRRWVCAGIHLHVHLPAIYAYTYTYTNSASSVANPYSDTDDYAQANAYAQAAWDAEGTTQPAAAPMIWGAQAASLRVLAACRDGKMEIIRQLTVFKMLPAGLPATTG